MCRPKEGPFGLEECSQGDWNPPSITIYKRDYARDEFNRITGDSCSLDLMRPKIHGGCMGLVEMTDGTWHYMGEDDDHYFTKAIMSKDGILDMYDVLVECSKNLEPETNKLLKSEDIAKGNFTADIEERPGTLSPLLTLIYDNRAMISFDAAWLNDRLKILKVVADAVR